MTVFIVETSSEKGVVMVTLILFFFVIKASTKSDVVVLLGGEFQSQIEFYTEHLFQYNTSCLNDTQVDSYPGHFLDEFDGRVGSIYIENIGIFICGGHTIAGRPEGGCNWLRVNHPVEGNSVHHNWQKIGYVPGQSEQNMWGCAVVEQVVHGSPGFWITGGGIVKLDPTTSTYDWEYSEEGVKDITYHEVPKEPFGRIDHCLVRVKIAMDPQNFQYLEIGGSNRIDYEAIDTYHCIDSSCSARNWTEQRVEIDDGWERPSCTVYHPVRSENEAILVVSSGRSWKVSCGAWLADDFTCTWNITENTRPISADGMFINTDYARLVTLDNLPTLFGVGGSGTQVFQFKPDDTWSELPFMERARANLVAVSVPDDYICNGKNHSVTTTSTTTTTTTTPSTSTVSTTTPTTTMPTSSGISETTSSETCETEGSCSKRDGRGIKWEGRFGSEVQKDCPDPEGELSCKDS